MAFLTFKEILELIDKVADKGLSSVEIESAGMKLKVEGRRSEGFAYLTEAKMPSFPPMTFSQQLSSGSPHAIEAAPPISAPQAPAAPAEEPDEGLHIITSPIVGTFYRAANPESPMFVNVGDRVTKGAVLCIVEAMKLMNEIESDVEGVVAKIYPQNGQPIEYGEKLFALKV